MVKKAQVLILVSILLMFQIGNVLSIFFGPPVLPVVHHVVHVVPAVPVLPLVGPRLFGPGFGRGFGGPRRFGRRFGPRFFRKKKSVMENKEKN